VGEGTRSRVKSLGNNAPKIRRLPGGRLFTASWNARIYSGSGPVKTLFDQVMPEVDSLLTITGYVLGTFSASGGLLEQRAPATSAALQGSCLHDSWGAAATHLDVLYRTAGAWPSFDVFAPLEDVVRGVFFGLGLDLAERSGGPYLRLR
jgi:hypothetical protein